MTRRDCCFGLVGSFPRYCCLKVMFAFSVAIFYIPRYFLGGWLFEAICILR